MISHSSPRSLPQIYEEFYHTVNNADHDKDLRLWSNTHGVNMAMNWPQFEVRVDKDGSMHDELIRFTKKFGTRTKCLIAYIASCLKFDPQ